MEDGGLELLRRATLSKTAVTLSGDGQRLVFGDGGLSLAADADTGYRGFGSRKGARYTLGAAWFCLRSASLAHPAYVRECAAAQPRPWPIVSLPDRRPLLAYLTGAADFLPNVDRVAPPLPVSAEEAAAAAAADAAKPAKEAAAAMPAEAVRAQKRRLAERLAKRSVAASGDAGAESAAAVAELQGMDADKVMALRLRRRQRKRLAIDEPQQQTQQPQTAGEDAAANATAAVADGAADIDEDRDMEAAFVQADRAATKRIAEREVPLRTRESAMRTLGRDFAGIGDVVSRMLQEDRRSARSSAAAASAAAVSASTAVPLSAPGRLHAPIIFVPNALTASVSLLNVRRFLEQGVWEDPQQLTASKPTYVDVTRHGPAGRLSGVFHVIDNAQMLRPGDWDRVVGVFVLGAAWQFRGWKWEQPLDVLRNACGIFLKFENEDVPPLVRNWNVSVISISKSKRHLDNQASEKFWDILERYLISNKPQFCAQ